MSAFGGKLCSPTLYGVRSICVNVAMRSFIARSWMAHTYTYIGKGRRQLGFFPSSSNHPTSRGRRGRREKRKEGFGKINPPLTPPLSPILLVLLLSFYLCCSTTTTREAGREREFFGCGGRDAGDKDSAMFFHRSRTKCGCLSKGSFPSARHSSN